MALTRGLACLAAAAAIAGCGAGGDDRPRLVVSAAASLRTAFPAYAEAFAPARARFSFAGSDELAAQIRQGLRPDVYAAASTALPRALFTDGLVEEPVVFAANRLVLAVPAGSALRRLEDAAEPGRVVVTGSPSVPVGAYTRAVLARSPAGEAILANVRSEEPDVGGIVGKLVQGAADAGFVYATDVRAAGGRLRAVEIAPGLRPRVRYAAAVVRGGDRPEVARAFVAGLRGPDGRAALEAAGFEAP